MGAAWRDVRPIAPGEAIVRLEHHTSASPSQTFAPVPGIPPTAPEYFRRAFGAEVLVRCRVGEPVVECVRAAVEYWAVLRRHNGSEIRIAGTAVLRFRPDGLVQDHQDYWTQQEGAVDPPSGWGR